MSDTEPEIPKEPTFAEYPANCPPITAVLAEGGAFRITENDPPLPSDFLSIFEKGEEPRPKKESSGQRCKSRALSIYREIEDARQHLLKYPYAIGNRFIAFKTLTNELGKTLHSPPSDGSRQSHTEWWCADGIDRAEGFLIVE